MTRTPPWLKFAAGLVLVVGLIVLPTRPLWEGWLRGWHPFSERWFVGALAFLVNLVVIAWCWGIGAGTVRFPANRPRLKIAAVLFSGVVAVLTGVTYARAEVVRAEPPYPSCDWLLVACGVAGGALGAFLGRRAAQPAAPWEVWR